MSLTRYIPIFSLRSLLLAVLTLGASAALWMNWGPWRIEREFQDGEPWNAQGLCLSPDGCWVMAEYGASELIRGPKHFVIWNALNGQCKEFKIDGHGAHFGPNSTCLLAGLDGSNETLIWDLKSGTGRNIQDSLADWMTSPYFSPDSRRLFLMSGTTEFQILDTQSLDVVSSIAGVAQINIPNAGNKMCFTHLDGSVRVVEMSSGKELELIAPTPDWEFKAAYLARDGLIIEAAWTEHDEPLLLLVKDSDIAHAQVLGGTLKTVSPGGKLVLSNDPDGHTYRVTEILSGKERFHFRYKGHDLAFTEDEKLLVCLENMAVYEVATGSRLQPAENAGSAELFPGMQCVLREELRKEGEYFIYDFLNRRTVQTLRAHRLGVDFTRPVSSDGQVFVSQHNDTNAICLWRLRRPHTWWGAACLAEFWVALTAMSGFVWSVRSDRRRKSVAPARNCNQS